MHRSFSLIIISRKVFLALDRIILVWFSRIPRIPAISSVPKPSISLRCITVRCFSGSLLLFSLHCKAKSQAKQDVRRPLMPVITSGFSHGTNYAAKQSPLSFYIFFSSSFLFSDFLYKKSLFRQHIFNHIQRFFTVCINSMIMVI